jgi:hypothetical protein
MLPQVQMPLLLVLTPLLLEPSPVNLESRVNSEEPEKLLVPSLRKLELEFSLD